MPGLIYYMQIYRRFPFTNNQFPVLNYYEWQISLTNISL